MTRDSQSAFPVALRRKPLRDWDAADRTLLLLDFRGRDFSGLGKHGARLRDLQRLDEVVSERAAKGIAELNLAKRAGSAARAKHEREARPYFTDADHIAQRLLEGMRVELETESVESGPGAFVRRVKLPLGLAYTATDFYAQLGLAILEDLVGAKQSGRCPYCGRWWTAADLRKRSTCGRDSCDAQRKAQWRRANPEPAERVNERVRRFRKAERARARRKARR